MPVMLFFCSLFRGRMVGALRHADKAGEPAAIDPLEVSALLDAWMP